MQSLDNRERESEAFFAKFNIYTDLAIEAHDVVVEQEGPPELPGVIVENEETEYAKISRVTIESDVGAKMMGKAIGNYSTIEAPVLREHNREVQQEVAQLLSKELKWFLDKLRIGDEDTVLVVGLGNWNATPDALGPKTVGDLMVTRHLLQMSPPELRGGLRPVAAIAPGVLGLTGIETGEVIKGIVGQIDAKALICIDALASRSVDRLCSTVQVSDSGINPGAGVGNRRMPINQEVMGIPVISIGVPTVVHAATIVADAMDLLSGRPPGADHTEQEVPQRTEFNLSPEAIMGGNGQGQAGENANVASATRKIPQEQKLQMITEVLQPFMGTMVVTPKEIDELVDDVTQIIAGALNTTFHEGVDYGEVFQYLR